MQIDILACEIIHITKGTLACKTDHRIPLNGVCLPKNEIFSRGEKVRGEVY